MDFWPSLITKALEQGGAALVAVVLVWFLRDELRRREEGATTRLLEERARTATEREDKLSLIGVLREVSETMAGVKAVLSEVCRQLGIKEG